MKYNFFIFLTMFFFIACNQPKTSFSIKGTLDSGFQADSVFLYNDKEEIVASAAVKSGKFILKGSVSEPQNAVMGTQERGMGKLILENADYTYDYKNGRIYIKGGPLHNLVLGFESGDEYNDAVDAYMDMEDAIYAGGDRDPDDITPEEKRQLKEKMNAALNIENRNLNKVIDDPQAPVLAKAFAVSRTQEWERYSVENRIALLKSYEKELGGSNTIAALRALWEEMDKGEKMKESVGAGKMFKDIEAKDVNGNTIKLSDIIAKNKYTILEFWASWCGPCRGEIPNLKKAYARYKSKGLEIFAISLDNNKDKWVKALTQENTPWLNVVDKAAFKGEAAKAYGISGVPASFLIGQNGEILVSDEKLRGKELEETLNLYMY